MKLFYSFFLLLLLVITANAQTQQGIIHGKILDQNKNTLPGANTAGLEQNGYGLLNFNGGVDVKKVKVSFFVNNVLGEKYIISAGNTGSLFGDTTQIPGDPGSSPDVRIKNKC